MSLSCPKCKCNPCRCTYNDYPKKVKDALIAEAAALGVCVNKENTTMQRFTPKTTGAKKGTGVKMVPNKNGVWVKHTECKVEFNELLDELTGITCLGELSKLLREHGRDLED